MAISLPDLPAAVKAYLNTKVTVTVDLVADSGTMVNPGEPCHLLVSVKNTSATQGGIALTKVRYQIRIANPDVLKVFVLPHTAGTTIDGNGHPLTPDTLVGFMEYDPNDANQSYLNVGEATSIRFNGRSGIHGGSTTITAKILADPDINALFPRNEDSAAGNKDVTISG